MERKPPNHIQPNSITTRGFLEAAYQRRPANYLVYSKKNLQIQKKTPSVENVDLKTCSFTKSDLHHWPLFF